MCVNMNGKFVAYYRVSTAQQGKSGLGLEAQVEAVKRHLNGGEWELLGEFTEVESGKRKNRPELIAAMALAKKQKATLIIAKLDRLARNLHFISGLLEAGVDFVAVDNPRADKFILQILAAVAENEARAISDRTKAALASAKARGVKLGKHGAVLGAENRKKALATLEAVRPVLREIEAAGIKTVRGIAEELNTRKVPTPTGGRWHPTSVHRLLSRMN
jgi:DNA invertase Pin-like site-specific DNA recombinase